MAVPPSFIEEACQDHEAWALASYETGSQRFPTLRLDTAWDLMWTLLDATRRLHPDQPHPESPGGIAVMGEHPLCPAFCEQHGHDLGSLIDHPRFVSASSVDQAYHRLKDIVEGELLNAHASIDLERVYGRTPVELIWPRFEALRDFYRDAADRGDAVIVCIF